MAAVVSPGPARHWCQHSALSLFADCGRFARFSAGWFQRTGCFFDHVMAVNPKIDKRYWSSKTLWILVAIVIVRTIFQIFATRFTKAYIVQLINLLAPFWVVLLNRIIVKTRLPQYTLPAISLSLLGSVLMVFGGLVDQPLALLLTQQDFIGITFAFFCNFWHRSLHDDCQAWAAGWITL